MNQLSLIIEVDEKVKNHVFSDASGQAGKLYEQKPMIITGSSSNTMSLRDYPIHYYYYYYYYYYYWKDETNSFW